ncbi:MAG: hypothetical protein AUI58_06725 [Chloroflexi bacterium 13_1_40CM_2_70_6]|nr:MAG: hypothetical protein AUI58_06725 [Chloroflexi bacterium 13_1_40CM_2_70_6]
MSGLELIFTGSALLGTALLLLSSVGSGMRVRVHVPFRLPHPHVRFLRVSRSDDATILPIILGFLAMFGIGGLFGAAAFGFGPLGQSLVALGFGAFGAAVAFGLFAALRRAEGREPTALRELVGRRARVVVSIDPASRGAVTLSYDGAVQTLPAVAATRIPRGQEVEISGVRGLALTVRGVQPP